MSEFVVDASVSIKWFLPEIHYIPARNLLSGFHFLMVPDLFFPEFGDILWKKVGRDELSDAEAREVLAALLTIGLRTVSSEHLLSHALEIALETECTVYDALYLALAATHDIALVTADRRLYDRIRIGPLMPHVLWVEDVK
ncbi:MAG: type II toxin-antitoxin system VapC family toxin [Armatimonadetes bacterium]|jgi:predicted nucleic acid-binding protein|nr:type II toxin-antitoxin system VapC family toxin [Armatimonadota bacterium]HOC31594.1 type II toxin-antitoxin system VapC family toxin [Armatimonadota bacterium]